MDRLEMVRECSEDSEFLQLLISHIEHIDIYLGHILKYLPSNDLDEYKQLDTVNAKIGKILGIWEN